MIKRPFLSAILAVAGLICIAVAFITATDIPRAADAAFDALVRDNGGRLVSSPDYPGQFRRLSADRMLLQNAYIGISGIVLLTGGTIGLVTAAPRE